MALATDSLGVCNLALSHVGHDQISSLSASNKASRQCNLNYSNSLETLLEKYDWNFARKRDRLTAAGILVNSSNVITITGNTAPTADTVVSDGGDGKNFTDSDVGFESGDLLRIVGSGSNDGLFNIDTADTLTLTMDTHEDMTSETLTSDTDLKLYAVPGGNVYGYKFIKPSDCVIVRTVNEKTRSDKLPRWDEEKTYVMTSDIDNNDQINISYTQRITDVTKFPAVFIDVLALIIAIKIVMPVANSRTLRADLVSELDDVLESARFTSAIKGHPETDPPDNAFSHLEGRT